MAISLKLPPFAYYIGDSTVRNVHVNFHKKFPHPVASPNKYTQWLGNYSVTQRYPHCQKLIFDLANEFPICQIEDAKVIDSINAFYESVKIDQQSILNSFGFLLQPDTIKYLIESGASFTGYHLGELIDLLHNPNMYDYEYGLDSTNPKIQEFIHHWPGGIRRNNSILNFMMEMYHFYDKYCVEPFPLKQFSDMVVMGITDFEGFGKLPVITDDESRAVLMPLFTQYSQFRKMPNTFEVFSKYPNAIKCLKGVQDPERVRKQVLTILFPHHIDPNSCDAIIDFDLQERIGGWRTTVYARVDYIASWTRAHDVIERIVLIDDTDIKDRITLDFLWEVTCKHNLGLFGSYKEKIPEVVSLIVKNERQSFIYHMIDVITASSGFKKSYGDEVDPELEQKIWEERFDLFKATDNLEINFLQYSLLPRLFPGKVSRLMLCLLLDLEVHYSSLSHVEILFRHYFLNNGGTPKMKLHVIEVLKDLFEIDIDPTILNGLDRANFDSFVSAAYRLAKESNPQLTNVDSLIYLYRKKTKASHQHILRGEIASQISHLLSKSGTKKFLITKLVMGCFHNHIFEGSLNGVDNVRKYLNFLYSFVDAASFFRYFLAGSLFIATLDHLSTLDQFGIDFLDDISLLTLHET